MARRTLDNLISLMIPEVQKIFLEVMQDIVDEAFIDEMIKAIEENNPEALFKATGFTPAALDPIIRAIEKVYQDAGEVTGDGFPARIRTPSGSISFRFDMRNKRVEQDLREKSSSLITLLTDEARENVRVTLERGLIAGENPKKTALDIVGRIDPVTKQRVGGVIGLTNQQEQWVSNSRKYLENLDKNYFNLSLRDKRFDGIVKKAIKNNESLSSDQIEKLVTAYKNRSLKYRAETIARTETIQSINRAEYQAHMQLVDEDAINPNAIRKYWDSTGDRATRRTHTLLEKKYQEEGVSLDEPFVSPSGAKLLYPGDTSLGAPGAETINCRCRQLIKVDWLSGVE